MTNDMFSISQCLRVSRSAQQLIHQGLQLCRDTQSRLHDGYERYEELREEEIRPVLASLSEGLKRWENEARFADRMMERVLGYIGEGDARKGNGEVIY